ncbi:MAG: AAA family ATPase [Bacteroidales bacterium]|nr:AAA family ATPase [Bacteroidales bacterium]
MDYYDILIKFLEDHPASSRAEIKEGTQFKGSDATLKRLIAQGVQLEDIRVCGKGRATRYSKDYPDIFKKARKFPDGIQSFEAIRKGGYLYVDKTELIYDLCNHWSKYIFMSRPRRFGKSLLISTMKAYYEGRADLFEGLAIEKMEKKWTPYPVIRLDLSTAAYALNQEQLYEKLDLVFKENEERLGLDHFVGLPGTQLQVLIKRAYEKYGQEVVVLIDEYDSPLSGVIFDSEKALAFKNIMREFYAPLKKMDPYLRFVFITGITKFTQLSIFSALNNLNDISQLDAFSTICGFTEDELERYFDFDIIELASRYSANPSTVCERLKQRYDGYHFSATCKDVYNPFSLLRVFTNKLIRDYWFESGTPTLLFECLDKFGQDLSEIDGTEVYAGSFGTPTEYLEDAVPLFYQSGYLTIKKYNPESDSYVLGIPNSEVRAGLMLNLLPSVAKCSSLTAQNIAIRFNMSLKKRDVDSAVLLLKSFFAGIPYPEFGKTGENAILKREAYFKRLFYVVFSFMNIQIYTEVMNSEGRTDAVMVLNDTVYVIEFKLDATSAKEAIEQIDTRGYTARFAASNRKVRKLGLNFSSRTGTISDWIVEDA